MDIIRLSGYYHLGKFNNCGVKMVNKIIFLIALVSLVGCSTTLSKKAQKVKLADINMVKGCQLLDTVDGSSSVGNLMSSTGAKNAKNEVIEKAARLGATHIVLTGSAGGYTPYASGNAYKCP